MQELSRLGGRTAFVPVDVENESSCRALVASTVAQFGKVNVLVNNAGISLPKMPEEYTVEEWSKVLQANLTSAFMCAQAVYPEMKKAGGGKIINVASGLALLAAPLSVAYSASKAGMLQMGRALATAWGKDNIQVNAVLPGWTDTDMTRGRRHSVPGFNERVIARTPLGRWGEPEDFAGIAVFLASSASDFVTGGAFGVDGGYTISA